MASYSQFDDHGLPKRANMGFSATVYRNAKSLLQTLSHSDLETDPEPGEVLAHAGVLTAAQPRGELPPRLSKEPLVTHAEKTQHFLQSIPPAFGRFWTPPAPPGYRLLWRLGLTIPPPHFIGPAGHVLGVGSIFALIMMAAFARSPLQPEHGFGYLDVALPVVAGLIIGAIQAVQYRRSRRRLGLENVSWAEYPPPSGIAST